MVGKNTIVKTLNAGCGSTQLSKQAHIKMANRSSTALCTFIPRENGLQDDSAISKQCLTHLSFQKIRKMAELNVLLLLDFITKPRTQFQWMQQMYTWMGMIWETSQVR